jgi:hypothetical protein
MVNEFFLGMNGETRMFWYLIKLQILKIERKYTQLGGHTLILYQNGK